MLTNFYDILEREPEFKKESTNPFAAKTTEGEWVEGYVSIEFLNQKFGHLETAEEMINATESEGLKLYFDWLKQKGILN